MYLLIYFQKTSNPEAPGASKLGLSYWVFWLLGALSSKRNHTTLDKIVSRRLNRQISTKILTEMKSTLNFESETCIFEKSRKKLFLGILKGLCHLKKRKHFIGQN